MSRLLLLVILAVLPILTKEPSSATIAATEISVQTFSTLEPEPRALAASDLNEDGTPDLVVGYSSGEGNVLAVFDGDADSIYPNTPRARARRANGDSITPFEDVPRYFRVESALNTTSLMATADGFEKIIRVAFSRPEIRVQRADSRLEMPDVIASLRMRLNSDAVDDRVLIKAGQTKPEFILSATQATFTVTNTADSGPGSLRFAIEEAADISNAEIAFNIPPSSGLTISLQTPLPIIEDALIIDGTTQPGFAGTPIVEIDGSDVVGQGFHLYAFNCVIRGLVINGFLGNGIFVFRGGSNVIEGNFIGTNAAGNAARANAGAGILVSDSSFNTIGGATAAARNVVSGNLQQGITIGPQLDFPGPVTGLSHNNSILGNYVGTDASATQAIGNGQVGVFVLIASANEIGGLNAGEGNVISGNSGIGLLISSTGTLPDSSPISGIAENNLIIGNLIGASPNSTTPLGNACDGIALRSTSGNTIGISFPAAHNHIVGNGTANCGLAGFDRGNGISIFNASSGTNSNSNRIQYNEIQNNRGLGIDLGSDGVTPNDPLDSDSGPNGLQNYPTLTKAITNTTGTVISGTLASKPNETFTVQLFANTACDSSGNGEGSELIDEFDVTTNNSGIAAIQYSTSRVFQSGAFITATAEASAGDTSEFSPCVQVRAEATDLAIVKTVPPASPNPGANLTYTLAVTNTGPDDASGVIVTDSLPSQTRFISLTTSAGSCNAPPVNTNGTVTCTIPALASNNSAAISITVVIGAAVTGSFTNSASVTSATSDPSSSNNTSSIAVTVNPLADLFIAGTPPSPVISPDGASNLPGPGDDVTFTINVGNAGPANATNVMMTTSVPANTTLQALASPSGWSCSAPAPGATGAINCTIPSLVLNATASFSLTVRINTSVAGGISISNSGQISSSTPDPVSANNTFTTSVLTGSLGMSITPASLDFGTVESTPSTDPAAVTRTFSITNTGTALLRVTLTSLLRTGADVDSGKITTADDRSTFLVRLIRSGQADIPAPFGQVLTIGAGRQQDFRIVFNALIPILAGKFNGLAANQALPDTVTSRLLITPAVLSPAAINLTGRVNTGAKLVHPDDPRRDALVTMSRSGTNVTVECSIYDSNLDLATVRYQFLDSSGRTLSDPIDVNVGAAIRQSQLARGQGFKIEQRFDVPDNFNPSRVRITISDGGTRSAESGGSALTASFITVSAASFDEFGLAPGSIVAGFGSSLAPSVALAPAGKLPTMLNGISVNVRDGAGAEWNAPLFFVSPAQINYQLPEGISPGAAVVTVIGDQNRLIALGVLRVASTYPALFAANSDAKGVAAAQLLRISAEGNQTFEPVYRFDAVSGRYVPIPLRKGGPYERTFLVMYGTGIRHRVNENEVRLQVGDKYLPALFSGAHEVFTGLDQVNVELSPQLFDSGETEIRLRVADQNTNRLTLDFGGTSVNAEVSGARGQGSGANLSRILLIAPRAIVLRKVTLN